MKLQIRSSPIVLVYGGCDRTQWVIYPWHLSPAKELPFAMTTAISTMVKWTKPARHTEKASTPGQMGHGTSEPGETVTKMGMVSTKIRPDIDMKGVGA